MKTPGKSGEHATKVIGTGSGAGAPADMDKMITTVRTFPAGRLVVVSGPGQGNAIPFFGGSNSIGRDGALNVIALDFGDAAVHREHHAYLTSDKGVLTLADNGKPNPVKINGRPLSGEQVVGPADEIVIGMTTLRIETA